MALIVDIRANTELLERIVATRIAGSADADSVNTYRVEQFSAPAGTVSSRNLEHRYGDGALALAGRMIGGMPT